MKTKTQKRFYSRAEDLTILRRFLLTGGDIETAFTDCAKALSRTVASVQRRYQILIGELSKVNPDVRQAAKTLYPEIDWGSSSFNEKPASNRVTKSQLAMAVEPQRAVAQEAKPYILPNRNGFVHWGNEIELLVQTPREALVYHRRTDTAYLIKL